MYSNKINHKTKWYLNYFIEYILNRLDFSIVSGVIKSWNYDLVSYINIKR